MERRFCQIQRAPLAVRLSESIYTMVLNAESTVNFNDCRVLPVSDSTGNRLAGDFGKRTQLRGNALLFGL
jgi:hypothetical protein